MLEKWQTITIGVANLEKALHLWVDLMGFKAVASRKGRDDQLAQQWDIPAGSVIEQVLLGHGENQDGRLLLIKTAHSGPSVRLGAAVFDQCVKNIDIYVTDIVSRGKELQSANYSSRNALPSEIVAEDGTHFKEMHFHIHDDINLVLLELMNEPMPFNTMGFGQIGPIISVVADVAQEKKFYKEVLELEMLSNNYFNGSEIERMIGLPEGSGLDVSIWGTDGQRNAQLELVEYDGVIGKNLFSRGSLPNCGLHSVCFVTANAKNIVLSGQAFPCRIISRGKLNTLAGDGVHWSIYTPAGLRIDLIEPS